MGKTHVRAHNAIFSPNRLMLSVIDRYSDASLLISVVRLLQEASCILIYFFFFFLMG